MERNAMFNMITLPAQARYLQIGDTFDIANYMGEVVSQQEATTTFQWLSVPTNGNQGAVGSKETLANYAEGRTCLRAWHFPKGRPSQGSLFYFGVLLWVTLPEELCRPLTWTGDEEFHNTDFELPDEPVYIVPPEREELFLFALEKHYQAHNVPFPAVRIGTASKETQMAVTGNTLLRDIPKFPKKLIEKLVSAWRPYQGDITTDNITFRHLMTVQSWKALFSGPSPIAGVGGNNGELALAGVLKGLGYEKADIRPDWIDKHASTAPVADTTATDTAATEPASETLPGEQILEPGKMAQLDHLDIWVKTYYPDFNTAWLQPLATSYASLGLTVEQLRLEHVSKLTWEELVERAGEDVAQYIFGMANAGLGAQTCPFDGMLIPDGDHKRAAAAAAEAMVETEVETEGTQASWQDFMACDILSYFPGILPNLQAINAAIKADDPNAPVFPEDALPGEFLSSFDPDGLVALFGGEEGWAAFLAWSAENFNLEDALDEDGTPIFCWTHDQPEAPEEQIEQAQHVEPEYLRAHAHFAGLLTSLTAVELAWLAGSLNAYIQSSEEQQAEVRAGLVAV